MKTPIKKSLRFEVFKRDHFTCQYCGRKPPAVILHVDHILARANGGTNREDNLLTSCLDCNLGKGARRMDKAIAPINFSVQERREKLDQLRAYAEVVREEEELATAQTDQAAILWATLEGQPADADSWMLDASFEGAVRRFLKKLSLDEVLEAVHLTFSKQLPEYRRFRYFCGVCWTKIKDQIALAAERAGDTRGADHIAAQRKGK